MHLKFKPRSKAFFPPLPFYFFILSWSPNCIFVGFLPLVTPNDVFFVICTQKRLLYDTQNIWSVTTESLLSYRETELFYAIIYQFIFRIQYSLKFVKKHEVIASTFSSCAHKSIILVSGMCGKIAYINLKYKLSTSY